MIIFPIILLLGVLRLLTKTEKVAMCAGLYAGALLVLRILAGADFVTTLAGAVFVFVLLFGWFWLLVRFSHDTMIWLAVLALGFVAVALMAFA